MKEADYQQLLTSKQDYVTHHMPENYSICSFLAKGVGSGKYLGFIWQSFKPETAWNYSITKQLFFIM